MTDVLSEDGLRRALAELDGWELADGRLHQVFTFSDFVEAFGFMSRVALLAEKLDHHPDWSNSWNTVDIAIISHAAGGVTARCVELARRIDAI